MSIASSSQALARLEPFLLLAKSAKGAAAAKLVAQVTRAPGCFVFSELLDCEGIRQLASDQEYSSSYRLLELFAYGTYRQYIEAEPNTFPALDDAQLEKLRLLTLVGNAAQRRNLSYESLIFSLGLDDGGIGQASTSTLNDDASRIKHTLTPQSIRRLEDIIIDAMYAGILSAKLDQLRQRVEVESAMGRDVRGDDDIVRLSHSLKEWKQTTNTMLTLLQERINDARSKDTDKARTRSAFDEAVEQALMNGDGKTPSGLSVLQLNEGNTNPRNLSATPLERLASGGDMETDEDGGALRKKKSTSNGPPRSKRTRS